MILILKANIILILRTKETKQPVHNWKYFTICRNHSPNASAWARKPKYIYIYIYGKQVYVFIKLSYMDHRGYRIQITASFGNFTASYGTKIPTFRT